jgi:hypothetical protein
LKKWGLRSKFIKNNEISENYQCSKACFRGVYIRSKQLSC